jgi:hypothetical protein
MFLPKPALECDPPTYAFHIAGITDVYYHIWLIFLR